MNVQVVVVVEVFSEEFGINRMKKVELCRLRIVIIALMILSYLSLDCEIRVS